MKNTGYVALFLLAALLIFGSACAPRAPGPHIKIIVDIEKLEEDAEYPGEFWPEFIVINKGTTVTWTNDDSKEHIVTDGNGLFKHSLKSGASFRYTFKSSGNFTYHCDLFHEMVGRIIVE